METLLNQIKNRMQQTGFTYDESKHEWSKVESKMFGGGTIYINGQATQQKGQSVEVKYILNLCGECVITDLDSKKEEISTLCNFQTFFNNELKDDFEINIYPSEYNIFNKFFSTIFRIP